MSGSPEDVAAAHDLLQVPAAGSSPRPATAGHATFIAGLILRRAPGAELVIRPVLLNEKAFARAWDVAKDMAGFIGSGVDILNLSFGCYTDDGEPPLVLARAVSLVSAEILLVAAAGNHGDIDKLRAENKVPDAPWTRGLTSKTPVCRPLRLSTRSSRLAPRMGKSWHRSARRHRGLT